MSSNKSSYRDRRKKTYADRSSSGCVLVLLPEMESN